MLLLLVLLLQMMGLFAGFVGVSPDAGVVVAMAAECCSCTLIFLITNNSFLLRFAFSCSFKECVLDIHEIIGCCRRRCLLYFLLV